MLDDPVTVLGENEGEAPEGSPEAEKVTPLVKPPLRDRLTV